MVFRIGGAGIPGEVDWMLRNGIERAPFVDRPGLSLLRFDVGGNVVAEVVVAPLFDVGLVVLLGGCCACCWGWLAGEIKLLNPLTNPRTTHR